MPRPLPSAPAAALLALAAACAGRAPAAAGPAPSVPATAAPVAQAPADDPPAAAAFAWPGTYALTGHGFEEGDREAVFTVTRRDTAHAVAVQGPPGELVSFRLTADSAHVLWALDAGGPFMVIDLRGRGDSVTGRWAVGTAEGPITGYRRR